MSNVESMDMSDNNGEPVIAGGCRATKDIPGLSKLMPDPTNAQRNGGRAMSDDLKTDAAESSRSRHCSSDDLREDVERDWAALARKLADEPKIRDPNAAYGQCGKIPQTNEDFVYELSLIFEECFPWLQVKKATPTRPGNYLFSITMISDEQRPSHEVDSIDHSQTQQTESTEVLGR
jgi:hypothetical protein